MNIDTVIFDIGGVLSAHGSHARLIEGYGIKYDRRQAKLWNDLKKGRLSNDEYWKLVVEGTGQEDKEKEINATITGTYHDKAPGGAVPYVQPLKDAGYKLAILSNHATEWGQAILRGLDLEDKFDEVIISADVGLAKPDHEIYHVVLDRIGSQPETSLFIDDKILNVMAAQDVRLHTIHYKDGESLGKELAEYGLL